MKTIEISSKKFAEIVLSNTDKIGSTDWDIYTDLDGRLDLRHQTHNNADWYEVCDLYNFWNDDETLSSSVEELASWLESDGMPYFDDIESYDCDEDGEREKITIEWA